MKVKLVGSNLTKVLEQIGRVSKLEANPIEAIVAVVTNPFSPDRQYVICVDKSGLLYGISTDDGCASHCALGPRLDPETGVDNVKKIVASHVRSLADWVERNDLPVTEYIVSDTA